MALKILVIDNHTRLAERLTRAAFDQQDCQIITATSVALAVFLARKNFPSLIISGANNATDDLDLTREIKTDPDLANIPVIVLSAQQNEEVQNSARAAGANKYLCGPMTEDQLFRELSPYLVEKADDRAEETSE